ncbi:hypothetical protein GCM10027036_32310 [Flavihumibacter cheonanensis]|uniref:hypothetical protein n=1 Tax=Flavihumibacter cheonanensis TaxID=1442385 RepID=UPI001EF8A93E|nr:hypothetical protein [Flavihumibacter cheonanensis]MCG7752742.1 hypothetical protein [Flavihumibacter cheonanensis]
MEYKILDWAAANELRKKGKGKFQLMVEATKAQLFQLKDGTYLLMPINPFGNSIHIMDKNVFDNWVSTNEFPIIEEATQWYHDNKLLIDDLLKNKEKLKKDLLSYVYKDKDYHSIEITDTVIDEIFEYIKTKRKLDNFRLHFIVLAGDYLMKDQSDMKWGVLKTCLFVNPMYLLSIIKTDTELNYYNLEAAFFGKWGYAVMLYYKKTFKSEFRPASELEEIIFL